MKFKIGQRLKFNKGDSLEWTIDSESKTHYHLKAFNPNSIHQFGQYLPKYSNKYNIELLPAKNLQNKVNEYIILLALKGGWTNPLSFSSKFFLKKDTEKILEKMLELAIEYIEKNPTRFKAQFI